MHMSCCGVICMSASGDRLGLCTFYSSRKVACSVPFTNIQFSRAFKYGLNSCWLCFWAETGRWIRASLKIALFFQGLTGWIFCTASENNESALHLDFQRFMKAGTSAGATWLILLHSRRNAATETSPVLNLLPQLASCATRWLHFSANAIIPLRY